MTYITSTASNNGDAMINVYFKQGSNADMAAVNVQNRVSTALSLLPAEVTKVGVTTMKQQNAELKTFSLFDPTGKYDLQFLNNYMKINVEPRIKRIGGVGNMMLFGSNYSMRIWMKPDKMAQYGLIPSDITAMLERQNIEAATGAFGENHDNAYQYTMKYRGRYSTPEEFGELVVRSLPSGEVLRLNEVADVVAGWTKIPVKKLAEEESERLKNLENILHERVVGQEEAITAVSKAIRRGRIGLKDPKRPIGSFLFLGPTGVGKTELSKALAEAMFGTETSLIRVDMSEYMEKHSVSKMIGSPPGYVGYEEGGQLSEKVRRNPYSVILFDEIEKAHPDVFNILLQVLDDGHITDAQGRKIDFKNTIIIMTSNAGAENIIAPKRLGFGVATDAKADHEFMKGRVMEEVKRLFKPEFLNRIDEIIVFHQLTKEHMKGIADIMLKGIEKRCKEQLGITLTVNEAAKELLIDKGYDEKYGARPLRRTIQSLLEDKMAEEILDGKIKKSAGVEAGCEDGRLIFTVKKKAAARRKTAAPKAVAKV